MFRSLSSATRLAVAASALALPAVLSAQDTRPVVVVFSFTNSSIGAGHAEFDGIATGVQDLLITDMASNPKIRLVDRSSIDAVLREQNMVKGGQVDAATAVRLGKIMGAQYAVIGGFLSDGKGNAVLTGRTVDLETTQIANPEKITGKSDDVLAMIGDLSNKLGANMKLAAKPGTRVGDAGDAASKSAPALSAGASAPASATAPAQSPAPAPASASAPASAPASVRSAASAPPRAPASRVAQTETYAKPVAHRISKTKLDVPTMKLYSNALDEMDKQNHAKAVELFKQVVAKYPDFEPAQQHLEQLKSAGA